MVTGRLHQVTIQVRWLRMARNQNATAPSSTLWTERNSFDGVKRVKDLLNEVAARDSIAQFDKRHIVSELSELLTEFFRSTQYGDQEPAPRGAKPRRKDEDSVLPQSFIRQFRELESGGSGHEGAPTLQEAARRGWKFWTETTKQAVKGDKEAIEFLRKYAWHHYDLTDEKS